MEYVNSFIWNKFFLLFFFYRYEHSSFIVIGWRSVWWAESNAFRYVVANSGGYGYYGDGRIVKMFNAYNV